MVILRKATMPGRLNCNQHQQSNQRKISNQLSSSFLYQPKFSNCPSSAKSTDSNFAEINRFMTEQPKSSAKNELKQIISMNRYTLNLTSQKNSSLPNIPTLKMAKKMLISHQLFSKYEQINKVCLPNFSKNAAKPLSRKATKTLTIVNDKNVNTTTKQSNYFSKFTSGSKQNNIEKGTKQGLSLQDRKRGNWKLNDFLDPIIQEGERDEAKTKRLRERIYILQKLKSINNQCIQLENERAQSRYIQAFSNYSKNLAEELIKKRRKIDKVRKILM